MAKAKVALVDEDPEMRLEMTKAFEDAPAAWDVSVGTEVPAGSISVGLADGPDQVDVTFDPDRPAASVQAVEELIGGRLLGNVSVITAPSGGTGVTTVALHLAAHLARRASTCLIDLDVRWGGVAERLGFAEERTKTWADVGSTPDSLRLAAIPVPGGFRALLAPKGGECDVASVIRRAAEGFERVVIDAPADSPLTEDALSVAPAGVLVAPATPGGVRRAADLLDAHPGLRWAVLLNRLGGGGELSARALTRKWERAAIELPCAPSLRDVAEKNELLQTMWSRWHRRVGALARALEKT
jgi:MinD-like ATPase involved in chromosome partitioning or flagellar assembly